MVGGCSDGSKRAFGGGAAIRRGRCAVHQGRVRPGVRWHARVEARQEACARATSASCARHDPPARGAVCATCRICVGSERVRLVTLHGQGAWPSEQERPTPRRRRRRWRRRQQRRRVHGCTRWRRQAAAQSSRGAARWRQRCAQHARVARRNRGGRPAPQGEDVAHRALIAASPTHRARGDGSGERHCASARPWPTQGIGTASRGRQSQASESCRDAAKEGRGAPTALCS